MFKVGIIGPESTGKSTLSHYLARRYGGMLLPEYARVYLEERARAYGCAYAYTREDVLQIAAYQVEELREWLMEAGFTHVQTYGDCRMNAPRENEQRIYFTAVRGR